MLFVAYSFSHVPCTMYMNEHWTHCFVLFLFGVLLVVNIFWCARDRLIWLAASPSYKQYHFRVWWTQMYQMGIKCCDYHVYVVCHVMFHANNPLYMHKFMFHVPAVGIAGRKGVNDVNRLSYCLVLDLWIYTIEYLAYDLQLYVLCSLLVYEIEEGNVHGVLCTLPSFNPMPMKAAFCSKFRLPKSTIAFSSNEATENILIISIRQAVHCTC